MVVADSFPHHLDSIDSASKRRRIAFVITSMIGGGAERQSIELATYFAMLGNDVDLVILKFDGPLLNNLPNSINLITIDPDYLSRVNDVECSIPFQNIRWFHENEKIDITDFFRIILPNWPLGMKVLPRRANRYVINSHSIAQYFSIRHPTVVMAIELSRFQRLSSSISLK